MYVVYILKSLKLKSYYYTGSTNNLDRRIVEHNLNSNKSTKGRGPFLLVYSEFFQTKQEAISREFQIKSFKGGNAFKKLLNI